MCIKKELEFIVLKFKEFHVEYLPEEHYFNLFEI